MQRKRRLVQARNLLLVACLVGLPERAALAEPDPRADARVHYERGLALVEGRLYEAALVEFRQAYERSPHFAVLYNIGLCEVALGHPLEAVEALSKYLREGGAEVPANRRQQVEMQVAELESRFAELSITAEPSGARIVLDGREIGRAPLEKPVRVPAGAHEISASLEGSLTASRRIDLAEAERRTIDFVLTPAPLATAPAASLPPPAHTEPPPLRVDEPERKSEPGASGTWRTVGYVLSGAGVAAGVGGAVHFAWNRRRHDDWQAEQTRLSAVPPPLDYQERADANNELAASIDRASAVTVGLFVASGVLLAGGVTLVVVDPGGRNASVAWRGTW
jgi:hypothetical protein